MSNATRTPQQAMADAIKSGAVQAFADGNPIQVENYGTSDWTPFMHTDPEFHSPRWGWRPDTTLRWRPWKPEEVPHLARIRNKSWLGFEYSTIVGIVEGSIEFTTGAGCDEVLFKNALENFTHSLDGGKTWHPCGVQEGGE